MARLLLQMMLSLDGMVSGPKGELDWTLPFVGDEKLIRDELAVLKKSKMILLGTGVIPEISGFWTKAEHDEQASAVTREFGREINAAGKVVYSHRERAIDWRNAVVHVVENERAFVEDVRRQKQENDGTLLTYGGVRLARSLLTQGLIDELRLAIVPRVLGVGQPLFTDSTRRIELRLRESAIYEAGTAMVHYNVMQTR
jgi:dihydrofolate reductase